MLHATAFINSNRDPAKHPDPFMLPAPWKRERDAGEVTEEERILLRQELASKSVFAN